MPKETKASSAKRIKAAYERLFATDDGKAVLADLIDSTGILGPSVDYANASAIGMAFNDGAKSIVHRIIHQVNMNPEQYLSMIEQKYQQEDFQL